MIINIYNHILYLYIMYTIIYQDEKGFSALHSASNNGHTDIVKRLLNYKDIEVDIRDMVRLCF